MNIKAISGFRDIEQARQFLNNWTDKVKSNSGTNYERMDIPTSLGNTVVWGLNTNLDCLPTIVIFPGYRTSSLFWDIDGGLAVMKKDFRIFLVETNGQPNLSDGNIPDIYSNDYGIWATEVFNGLKIKKAVIAGTSFGALICLKLCLVSPHLVDKAILMNPGCLQPFSFKFKNLFYNFLPIIFPTRMTVNSFLDNAILFKEHHQLSPVAKNLIIEYELFVLKRFKDRGQKPYKMSNADLNDIIPDVYLMVSDHDILFPFRESIRVASKNIKSLRETNIITETGHGMELCKGALSLLPEIILS